MFFQLFSSITPPSNTIPNPSDPQEGVIMLLNFGLKIIFILAGLLALINVIQAGFIFMGSSGDSKELSRGRDKFIWTFIGVLVMASAVVVAGLIGILVYGKWDAIITPDFTPAP